MAESDPKRVRFQDAGTVPPDSESSPHIGGFTPEGESGQFSVVAPSNIALVVSTAAVRNTLQSILTESGLSAGGAESIPSAQIIIVEPKTDVRATMANLRKQARTDAAIIAVFGDASAGANVEARAAGVFACMAAPFMPEELLGLIASARAVGAESTRTDLAQLASIGRFSAGLHHELANPLAATQMNLKLARRDCERLIGDRNALFAIVSASGAEREERIAAARERVPPRDEPEQPHDLGSEVLEALDDSITGVQRMTALLAQMKELVKRDKRIPYAVDLSEVLQEVRAMLAPHFAGIDERVVIDEPVVALADRHLLCQILMHLAQNALHAVRSLPSPRLRFHIYRAGAIAVVSVRDNGLGIAPELQQKVFEPFFTTRRGDGGTGLGLALCREYALQMDGDISLWSAPGRGACFRVRLPVA